MTDLIDAPVHPAGASPVATSPSSAPSLIGAGRSSGSPAARVRLLARPAGYYLASRAVMFAVAAVVAALHPQVRVARTLGTIFDGRWYLLIAQHGYPHQLVNEGDGSRWAFFPAFPAAVRGLAEITRLSLPDAGVVTASFFGLTSAVAIFLAVREVCGTRLADRAVLLYVCVPSAYVLSLAYTEGLFLTAAAGCLFALSRRYWVTAGLCACLAGFTRNAGIVVIAAVILVALPSARRSKSWRPVAAAALAPVGLAAFMLYSWFMVGTPVAFVTSERFWLGQHFVWFRTPVLSLLHAVRHGPTSSVFVPEAMAGGALVLGFLGLWWLDQMAKRPGGLTEAGSVTVPVSWWVYAVGTLFVAYSAYYVDSIARYAMVAFPLFAAFAWKLPRRWTWPVAVLLLGAQAALLATVLSALWHPHAMPLVP